MRARPDKSALGPPTDQVHIPPPGGELQKGLGMVGKELAGRLYQLISGHAATAEHLHRIGRAPGVEYWWCGSDKRQSRHHLHQVPALETLDQEAVTENREGLRVGVSQGPIIPSSLPRRASDPGPLKVPGGHAGRGDARYGPLGGGGG